MNSPAQRLRRFRSWHGLLLAAAWSTSAWCWAQPRDMADERRVIELERAAVEAKYAEQERECQTRFAVTACVEQAKRVRRSELADLRHRVVLLDERLRKQRAERRRDAIRDNLLREEAARRDAAASAEAAPLRRLVPEPPRRDPAAIREAPALRDAPKGTPARAPRSAGGGSGIVAAPDQEAAKRTREARSRAVFEARQDAARQHRREVQERNAARAAQGRSAAPLPAPAASAR